MQYNMIKYDNWHGWSVPSMTIISFVHTRLWLSLQNLLNFGNFLKLLVVLRMISTSQLSVTSVDICLRRSGQNCSLSTMPSVTSVVVVMIPCCTLLWMFSLRCTCLFVCLLCIKCIYQCQCQSVVNCFYWFVAVCMQSSLAAHYISIAFNCVSATFINRY